MVVKPAGDDQIKTVRLLSEGCPELEAEVDAFIAQNPDRGEVKISTAESSPKSDLYPKVGELWDCDGRTAFICGNSLSEDGRLWVVDWDSGERGDAKLEWLELRNDRKSLTEENILARFTLWARSGKSDAIWWLGWWFEGINHPKSVWYYIAALRADPQCHGWARQRIVSDAQTAYMCAGVPKPDLSFLDDIPEIQGDEIQQDWESAIAKAEEGLHIPACIQNPDYVSLARYSAPAQN